MKRVLTAAAAALIALSAGGAAMAQPNDHHDQGGYAHHDWRKGGRIAQQDWGRGQQVDWHRHHLRRPPRGYEWREVDGNYVLAAAATGLIASIIASSQH
ncbi:MAG TPA: RcnB family protein [Phenylobacterium sp.]|nr:RcnB family protein [Phenylobacterium sp.]